MEEFQKKNQKEVKQKKKEKADFLTKQAIHLGMDKRIVKSLLEMGFENLTPIQEQTIPLLLNGRDVIGQAQTGTGKTAAFGIPLLQNTDPENRNIQAIVLCPTRELAIQAAEELRRFAKYMHGIKVLPVYGGQNITRQIQLLKNVQIVVGTPGRVMDHMRRHTIRLGNIRTVVLDEADEMLNMGFREDIESILKDVPAERQTALFSATMPQPILDITHTYQKSDADYVRVTPKELTIPLVKQYYYEVRREYKEEATARLLDYANPKRSLIFCNTKKMVDDLAKDLKERGYQVEGLHGDLTQAQRDRVMNGFRKGAVEILIATDVAARGIDVDDVEVVINYDVPQDNEYYVHRIGRTGRAGKNGSSYTLVSGRDRYRIRDIERMCRTHIEERKLPSAGDVIHARAEKVLAQVMDVYRSRELDGVIPLIEETLKKEEITPLALAAAFLKLHMGEEPEEIPEISRSSRNGRRYGRDKWEERDRTAAGGKDKQRRDGGRADRKKKTTGRPQESKSGKGGIRAEESRSGKGGIRTEENRTRKVQAEKKKPVDAQSDKAGGKRKRHDHSGEHGKRQKLITGENKDYGYDTDDTFYRRGEHLPGHALEIKMKEPEREKRAESRKSGFLFFQKKS